MLEKDIKKILISQDEITEAAKKLGVQLTKDYEGKNPILVGILKGSIPFMAELVKHIDTHIEMDFMMFLAIMVEQQVVVSSISSKM